jgi:hypothetical protein
MAFCASCSSERVSLTEWNSIRNSIRQQILSWSCSRLNWTDYAARRNYLNDRNNICDRPFRVVIASGGKGSCRQAPDKSDCLSVDEAEFLALLLGSTVIHFGRI